LVAALPSGEALSGSDLTSGDSSLSGVLGDEDTSSDPNQTISSGEVRALGESYTPPADSPPTVSADESMSGVSVSSGEITHLVT
jgi:hypothetical protein